MAAIDATIQTEFLSLAQLQAHNALSGAFAQAEQQHFQYGLDWLQTLAHSALDAGQQARICVATDDRGNFVALPVKLHPDTHRAEALSTFYTSAWSSIASGLQTDALLTAACQALRKQGIGALTLAPMDSNAQLTGALEQALARAGWRGVHRYFCFGNWRHRDDTLDFAVYEASRPSRLRNTLARRRRKFLESSGGSIDIVRGGESLEQAIEDFVAVYNASWKRPEPYPGFIPDLIRRASQRGWLRLGIARLDGNAIAAQVWLVHANTAYIFKLAYREDYRQLSPGTILTGHMLHEVLEEDGVTCIDYLSGDDEYKQDWMSERREFSGIAAYNPGTPRGRVALVGHYLRSIVKGLLQLPRRKPAANNN